MFGLSKETTALLEDIERRIDPETEGDFVNQWRGFLFGGFDGELFAPRRKKLSPAGVNLSPALYREFGAPYDAELLQAYGGGVIHFCGRGDHYVDALAEIPMLYAINMSQPEYNDMEKIYQNTVVA